MQPSSHTPTRWIERSSHEQLFQPRQAHLRQPLLHHLSPPRPQRARGFNLAPPALQPQDPARKSPPPRRRRQRHRRRHRVPRQLGRQGRAQPRNRLHARPRPHAGLHRRPRRRRSRRHARRHEDPRRRSRSESIRSRPPSWSSTTPSRSTNSAPPAAYDANAAPRVPAQPRALRLPQVGPDRLPQLLRRAARHGHLPPGQSRIPRPRRLHHGNRRRARSPIPTRSSAPTPTPP